MSTTTTERLTTATKPLRAVLYTRVSTEEQADKGTSLESQLEACQRQAAQLGAHVTAHYEDAGISGGLYWEREGLQRALADLEAGRADTLIVATMSRLSRDKRDYDTIQDRIRKADARLIYCDAQYEDSAMGEFAEDISKSYVHMERRMIRERTMRGTRQSASNGTQPARRFSPYGYHIVTVPDVLSGAYPTGTQGTYQVIEERAAIVREIFTRYAAGASLFEVATWLQQSGIPTPRNGKAWQLTTLRDIMKNPVYKGAPAFGRRRRLTDKARRERGLSSTYNRPTDPATWIELEAPAIVDAAVWQTCQERLKENRALLGGRPTSHKYLLTGLMRCAACGRSMAVKPSHKNGRVYHYYHCTANTPRRAPGGDVCTPGLNSGSLMDELALRGLLEWVDRPELMESALQFYTSRSKAVAGSGEADKLREALRGLDARERATVDAQIAGIAAGADASVYARLLGDIAGQRKTLQARLDKLDATAPTNPRPQLQSMAGVFRELVGQAREVLSAPEVPTTRKREILTRVVQQVTPGDGGVYLHLRPLQDGAETLHHGSPFCRVLVFCSPTEVRVILEDATAEALAA